MDSFSRNSGIRQIFAETHFQEPVKLFKKGQQIGLFYCHLLQLKELHYLHTVNVSCEWITRLNIIHQVVRDLEISTIVSSFVFDVN